MMFEERVRSLTQITLFNLGVWLLAGGLLAGCGVGLPALADVGGQLPPAQSISTRAPDDEPPIVNNGAGFAVQAPADWGPLPVTQRPLITFQGTSD